MLKSNGKHKTQPTPMNVTHFIYAALVASAAAFFISCEDDSYRTATQRLDLVDFISDENGLSHKMVLDNGDTLRLTHPEGGFLPDTICRCQAVYRPAGGADNGVVEVTSLGQILTLPPLRYNIVYADPVSVTSAWLGGNYLNLRLLLRTKGSAHAIGFAFLGYSEADNGAQTLELMLYNNSGNDDEYFSRETFVSCALHGYIDNLKPGRDSVAIKVNEYDKGFVDHRLPLR